MDNEQLPSVQQAPASLADAKTSLNVNVTLPATPPPKAVGRTTMTALRRPKTAKGFETILVKPQDLEEDPDNARQLFDQAKLQQLADSITAQGLLQPVAVRKIGDRYRIIDGHRRKRAAELAGLKEIRCEVQDVDDPTAALAAATANLQREDLTPYEEARAYRTILDLLKVASLKDAGKKSNVAEVARLCGVAHNTVKHRLELLALPEAIGRRIDVNGFTIQHAQAFLGLKDQPKLLDAAIARLEKEKQLPTGYDMPRRVVEYLVDAKMVRQVGEGFQHWEHPNLVAKLSKLATAAVTYNNGHEVHLVTDVKAYDEQLSAALAAQKEAEAKERSKQAKLSTQGKGEKAKERVQRDLDQLAEKESQRLALAGMVGHLGNDKHVAEGIFQVLRELEGNDGLMNIGGYGVDAGTGERAWKAAGAAAGADTDAIGAWLDKDGDMGKGTPAWFTKLKPGRQLAFVTALLGTNEILGYPSKEVSQALTGKSGAEWLAKGRKEAQRTLESAKKAKPAHEEGKAKGKPGAKDAAPGPKASQSTLGVEKAKAKLAKKAR